MKKPLVFGALLLPLMLGSCAPNDTEPRLISLRPAELPSQGREYYVITEGGSTFKLGFGKVGKQRSEQMKKWLGQVICFDKYNRTWAESYCPAL